MASGGLKVTINPPDSRESQEALQEGDQGTQSEKIAKDLPAEVDSSIIQSRELSQNSADCKRHGDVECWQQVMNESHAEFVEQEGISN